MEFDMLVNAAPLLTKTLRQTLLFSLISISISYVLFSPQAGYTPGRDVLRMHCTRRLLFHVRGRDFSRSIPHNTQGANRGWHGTWHEPFEDSDHLSSAASSSDCPAVVDEYCRHRNQGHLGDVDHWCLGTDIGNERTGHANPCAVHLLRRCVRSVFLAVLQHGAQRDISVQSFEQ